MLATSPSSEALHIALTIAVGALTLTNVIVIWAWTRTIRAMREARDTALMAAAAHEEAAAQLRRRRGEQPI